LDLIDKHRKPLLASKVIKLAKSSKLCEEIISMSFPLRLPDQLKQHLRALRKGRGLTQTQLGALVGVKQARIAEIEANPGAVSLDQLTKVLAALGGTLHLHSADMVAHPRPNVAVPAQAVHPKALAVAAKKTPAKKASGPSPARGSQFIGTSAPRRKATGAAKPTPRTSIVIRPKKGAW
jgi:HTH-type transcriptional regulator / antitoxin HipB